MHLSDEIIRIISSYYVSGYLSWRLLLIHSSLSTPLDCGKLEITILCSFCDSLALMGKCSSLTRYTWSVLLLLAPIFPLDWISILRYIILRMVVTSLSGEYLWSYNFFHFFQGRLARLSALSQPGNKRFLVLLCSICTQNLICKSQWIYHSNFTDGMVPDTSSLNILIDSSGFVKGTLFGAWCKIDISSPQKAPQHENSDQRKAKALS